MKKRFNWGKHGFSQKRPKEPGVYFIVSNELICSHNGPRRLKEHWDIAEIYFYAGSSGNVFENREYMAHWRIKYLQGIETGWKKGMWIKGPINPFN